MAIKLPAIPAIEEPSELINLVANSPLYKERMTALVDIYGKIKVGLDEFNRLNEIDNLEQHTQAMIAEAKAKEAEANRRMDDANRYVADLKSRASEEVALKFAKLKMDETRLVQLRDELERRESALAANQLLVDAKQAELFDKNVQLEAQQARARDMEAMFHDKVERLKAVVLIGGNGK